MKTGETVTHSPPSGENYYGYEKLPVTLVRDGATGAAYVQLWTDAAAERPYGVIVRAEDEVDGPVTVQVGGVGRLLVGAGGVQPGGGTNYVMCAGAGATDADKAAVIPATATNYGLGPMVSPKDVAADGTVAVVLSPTPNLLD